MEEKRIQASVVGGQWSTVSVYTTQMCQGKHRNIGHNSAVLSRSRSFSF